LNNELIVLDELKFDRYKTKEMVLILRALKIDKKALIVLPSTDDFAVKSARNIEGIKTAYVNTLNTYDILNFNILVLVKEAVAKIEEVYA
jgi:large subunit ribosomal protein L4